MHRLNVSLVCLLSLSLAGSASAQPATISPSAPSGVTTYDGYSGGATLGTGTYFNIRHMTGNGVGYNGSYTQIGAFMPVWINENAFIAPDARLMVTNNSQVGGNLGLVGRYYNPGTDRILGGYGYFDMDQSSANNRYNQGTFGLESLGPVWDFRGNAYFPTGNKDNFVSTGAPICVTGNAQFGGNGLFFTGQQGQNREQALQGGDLEFGLPVLNTTPWLRAYAGMYFYQTQLQAPVPTPDVVPGQAHKDPIGFRARLDAWISDDLLAGVNVTTDPVWGTNVNAVIDFRFSGFRPTRYFPQWTTRERMLQPVQRNWRVAVDQYGTAVNVKVPGLNPAGRPYFIDFVNNAAPAGGNGTFEHPFNTLNFTNNGADIIFVEKGTSTAANPLKGSITLTDNQILLGQGGTLATPLTVNATYGDCSVTSTFQLPGPGDSSMYPFISNGGGPKPTVTLANNNEVTAINFVSSGGDAIFGNGITNFNLHDLSVQNNTGIGIHITNATGTTTVLSSINQNNIIDNPNPLGLGNNAGGGILVSAGPGGLPNLIVSDVSMNSNAPGGSAAQPLFGITLNGDAGPISPTLSNVSTNGNKTGLVLEETGHNLIVTFASTAATPGVTSNGNLFDGVDITGNGGFVQVITTGPTPLTANGNGTAGVGAGSGIKITQNGAGTQPDLLSLINVVGNGNSLDGIGLFSVAGGKIGTAASPQFITNGTFNNNANGGGVTQSAVGAGSGVFVTVDPTTLFGNKYGIQYTANGGTVGSANTFLDARIHNSVQDGVLVNATNAGTATVNIAGTTQILNSGINGILFNTDGAGSAVAISTLQPGLTINGSGTNGISGVATNGSTATVNLTGASIIGAANGDGILFNVSSVAGGPASTATFNLVNTTIQAPKLDGILGIVNGPATGTVNFSTSVGLPATSAPISNFGQNGIEVQAGLLANGAAGGTANVTVANTNIIGSLGSNDGILVTAASGANVTANVTGTNINPAGNAVEAIVSGSAALNPPSPVLTASTVNLNLTNDTLLATNGFKFNVTQGGKLAALFTDDNLSHNSNNAILGVVDGTTTPAGLTTTATVTLTGTDASHSGKDNVNLTAQAGGSLIFTAQGDLISNALLGNSTNGNGVVLNATGLGTVAQINLNGATVDSNLLGAGFVSNITTGATVYADLEGTSFSNNGLQGMNITATGAGSVAYLGVGQYSTDNGVTLIGKADTVSSNKLDGVLGTANTGGEIDFRSGGSNFGATVANPAGGNGLNGLDFAANGGTIRTLFYDGSAKGNGNDGLLFTGNNAASNITVSLAHAFTATGNGNFDLQLTVPLANSVNLLFDPNAPLAVIGTQNIAVGTSQQVVLQELGSFSGNAGGDGSFFNFANINTAVISFNGLGGTASGNAGDGIHVVFNNVVNGGVLVSNYSDISNNGKNGVDVNMTNVTNGAIEIDGVPSTGTTMNNNVNNAVNIQLTNTNLINGFSNLPGVNLKVLTIKDNNGADVSTPLPVLPVSGLNGLTPATSLNVNHLLVNNAAATSSLGGIMVTGTDSTIASGTTVATSASISNNSIQNITNGDGIAVIMNNTVAPTLPTLSGSLAGGMQITGNTVVASAGAGATNGVNNGYGIVVSVNNNVVTPISAADNLTITGNNVSTSSQDGILFQVTNPVGSTSTANGVQITGNVVSASNGGDGINVQLQNLSTANNLSVNGNATTGSMIDGININLANLTSANNLSVNGNVTSGSMIDGININLLNLTSANNLAVNGNTVTRSTTFDGINIQLMNLTSANAMTVTGNIVGTAAAGTANAGGISLVLTNLGINTLDISSNSVVNSTAADGIQVNGNALTLGTLTANSETITGNKGNGLEVDLTNSTLATMTLGTGAGTANTITGNTVNGVFLNLSTATLTTLNAANNNVSSNTGGSGLLVSLTNTSALTSATFTDSVFNANSVDGVQLVANDGTVSTANMTFTGSGVNTGTISNNTADGVKAAIGAMATANLAFNNEQMGNTGAGTVPQQNGLNYTVTPTGILNAVFTGGTINANNQDAIKGVITGNGVLPGVPQSTITLNGTTANGSGQDNLNFNVTNAGSLAVVLNQNGATATAITNSVAASGVNFQTVSGGSQVAFTAENSTTISGNKTTGVSTTVSGNGSLAALLFSDSLVNANGGDGVASVVTGGAHLNLGAQTTNVVNPNATPVTFSGNGGNGISLSVTGAGSVGDVDLHNAYLGKDPANALNTGNTLNGLLFTSNDGGTVNVRAYDTHFDGNGKSGLNGTVNDNTGAAPNTVGRADIIGGTANGNGVDGFGLFANNTTIGPVGGAEITGQFQADTNNVAIAATGNVAGYGIDFVTNSTSGKGIVGNLLMTGGSNLTGNGIGSTNVSMAGADTAIIGLSGVFDNNVAGDGIGVSLKNITNALVVIQGPGEAKGNGGNGVNVSLDTIQNGGVFIGGFNTGITGNALDGIKVSMNDVGFGGGKGALTIDGNTSTFLSPNLMNVSNNGANGVEVHITGGSNIDNTGFTATVPGVTVVSFTPPDQLITTAHPAFPPIPDPLLTTTFIPNPATFLGVAFSPTVSIQHLTMDNNGTAAAGGDGILMVTDNSTLVGTPTINTNTITRTGVLSPTGTNDAVQVQLINGAKVGSFSVMNNRIGVTAANAVAGNNGNGVNIIAGGVIAGNSAATLTSLNISGNTISNSTGTSGATGNGTGNGVVLQLINAPLLSTITLDSNSIQNNSGDGFQMVNPNTGATNLTATFTRETITGNGTQFVAPQSNVFAPGSMGIDIVLNNNNSTVTNIDVYGESGANGANVISGNKSFGLLVNTANTAIYNLNVVRDPAVNATTVVNPSIFNGNFDAGIGIVAGSFVDPVTHNLDSTKFTVGTVDIENVSILNTQVNAAHNGTYPFAGDGIGMYAYNYAQLTSFQIGASTASGPNPLRNTMLTGNAGAGVNIQAINNSQFFSASSTLGNPTILIQNVDATGSTAGAGIQIRRQDNAALSWDTTQPLLFPPASPTPDPHSWESISNAGSFIKLNDVQATGNAGAGLSVLTQNAQFAITRIDVADTNASKLSHFDSNGSGMSFISQADSILVAHVTDTTISNNTNIGVFVRTDQNATFGNVVPTLQSVNGVALVDQSTFNGVTISNNGQANGSDGFQLTANDASDIVLQVTKSAANSNSVLDSNGGNGINLTSNSTSHVNMNLNALQITNNKALLLGGNGLKITTNNASNSTVLLTNARIGDLTPSKSNKGMSGNGVFATSNGSSTLTLTIGNPALNTDPNVTPDVGIFGNQLNGILVANNGSAVFNGFVNNTASQWNAGRGYSAQMTADFFSASSYNHTLNDSTFTDNGKEGIAFIANAGNASSSSNNNFVDVLNGGPAFIGLYNPNNFLRLNTSLHSKLVLTNSFVENNGTGTPYNGSISAVNGLQINVSTNSLVQADIRNNVFGGNVLADVATTSFTTTAGGFDANGNPTGAAVNTVTSLHNVDNNGQDDRIYIEDTAQLDMRFMNNFGDKINVTSAGANMSDASGAKVGDQVSLFQVDAFHYDTVASFTATTLTGANLEPRDTASGNFVKDANNFPADSFTAPVLTPSQSIVAGRPVAPNLQAGILSTTGATVTGPNVYVNNTMSVGALPPPLQVRIDNTTTGASSTITAYNPSTGTFTTGLTVANNDVFRVHLLDTNTFTQAGAGQNIENHFAANFETHTIPDGTTTLTIKDTQGAVNPTPPPPFLTTFFNVVEPKFHTTTPLEAYFTFPDTPTPFFP